MLHNSVKGQQSEKELKIKRKKHSPMRGNKSRSAQFKVHGSVPRGLQMCFYLIY